MGGPSSQPSRSEVVEGEEFLSLPFEQLIALISSDELTVSSEEKVFECVICWVNHEPGCRKDLLPKLIEYVHLPLTSSDYLIRRVEPFLKNNPECKDYILEAFRFHLLKDKQSDFIPKTIRTKPRHYVGSKIIFVVGGKSKKEMILDSVEWYDLATNCWHSGPKMSTPIFDHGLAVLEESCVFAVGGCYNTDFNAVRKVNMLDLSSSSPCWVPTVSMLTKRSNLRVAVLDNCIYAVGGFDGTRYLRSAEIFHCSTQGWRKISDMSTNRMMLGIVVLNKHLYAIGGHNGYQCLKSAECYHPKTNTWTPIANMSVPRLGVGVGVLDDSIYAVGGFNGSQVISSVEAYKQSTGVWTFIADMHICRRDAGVITMGGLLYVVGGFDGASYLGSVEMYDPKTKTWSMLTNSMNIDRAHAGVVVIDKAPHLNT